MRQNNISKFGGRIKRCPGYLFLHHTSLSIHLAEGDTFLPSCYVLGYIPKLHFFIASYYKQYYIQAKTGYNFMIFILIFVENYLKLYVVFRYG